MQVERNECEIITNDREKTETIHSKISVIALKNRSEKRPITKCPKSLLIDAAP